MDCKDAREKLPFLGDGSLEPEVERAVRGHLLKCTACEREYDELRTFLNLTEAALKENTQETLPGYLGLVRNRIRKKRIARKVAWRVIPVAAAVLLMAATAVFMSYDVLTGEEQLAEGKSPALLDSDSNQSYGEYYDLDAYDLDNMVSVDQSTEEKIIVNTLFTHTYDDVTPEDILQLMNDDQYGIMLTSSK